MKTLTDHTIIYDNECPLCNEYTQAFVKTGMLAENGREAFSEISMGQYPSIDWNRARNEIALINKKNNTVIYGIDSLMVIIANSFPALKPLFNFRPFHFIMQQVYFFISYNRKVIAPSNRMETCHACAPSFNLKYRIIYIVFAWLFTSIVLLNYTALLVPILPATSFYREFAVCGGQILFQAVVIYSIQKEKIIYYLGNLMTVSLMGALALIPAFLMQLVSQNPYIYLSYFMLVVFLMFLEHWRRVKILELPYLISISWVLYRILIVCFIFI